MTAPVIEMKRRRRTLWGRIAWTLPLGLVLFGGGLFLLTTLLSRGFTAETLQVLGVWFFVAVVMLVGAYDTARVAAGTGAALVIDDAGVFDRRIQRAILPWSGIDRAEIRTISDRPIFVGLWGPGVARARRQMPFWNYFGLLHVLAGMAARAGYPTFALDLEGLEGDAEAVIAALEARLGPIPRRDAEPEKPVGAR